MEITRIERDRSETALRWVAAGLGLAVLVLAAACGGEAGAARRGADSARGSAEGVEVVVALPSGLAAPGTVALAPAPRDSSVHDGGGSAASRNVQSDYGDARAAFLDGRFGEAVDLFMRYAERRPTDPRGHYMLGLAAWKGGYLDLAEAHLMEAALIDSAHVRARVNLARVLIERGQPAAAERQARRAEELDGGDVAAKRTLARALARKGDREGALAKYEEALWIDPDDAWSLNNMAYLMIQGGREEAAVAPLALAVTLDPDNATFAKNLSSALAGAGLGAGADLAAIAQAYRAELVGCVGEGGDTVPSGWRW